MEPEIQFLKELYILHNRYDLWSCLLFINLYNVESRYFWELPDSTRDLSQAEEKINVVKGQTKLKLFFQADISSKKRMSEFNFTTMRLVFVHFLGEIEDI